ncbi:MAG: hypothetical protein U0838_02385 [Chloroflexota bacterium]
MVFAIDITNSASGVSALPIDYVPPVVTVAASPSGTLPGGVAVPPDAAGHDALWWPRGLHCSLFVRPVIVTEGDALRRRRHRRRHHRAALVPLRAGRQLRLGRHADRLVRARRASRDQWDAPGTYPVRLVLALRTYADGTVRDTTAAGDVPVTVVYAAVSANREVGHARPPRPRTSPCSCSRASSPAPSTCSGSPGWTSCAPRSTCLLTQITPDMVGETIRVSPADAPADAARSPDEVVGSYAAVPILAGQAVDRRALRAHPGERALGFGAPLAAGPGRVRAPGRPVPGGRAALAPGARVDIVAVPSSLKTGLAAGPGASSPAAVVMGRGSSCSRSGPPTGSRSRPGRRGPARARARSSRRSSAAW